MLLNHARFGRYPLHNEMTRAAHVSLAQMVERTVEARGDLVRYQEDTLLRTYT